MSNLRLLLSTAIAVGLLAGPARGQEPNGESSPIADGETAPDTIEDVSSTPETTTVQAIRTRRKRATKLARPHSPEEALDGVAGVALSRSGGPLAPASATYRGLGGPRLNASLNALALNAPGVGDLDVNRLPWFALRSVRANAIGQPRSTLAFALAPVDVNFVRGRIGAGSFQTVRTDLVAGAPLFPLRRNPGALMGAVSVASTRGDFTFDAKNALGVVVDTDRRRSNNDQLRASALVHARSQEFSIGPAAVHLNGLLLATTHRGGVPGFSTAPPLVRYRAANDAIGVATSANASVGQWNASVSAQLRTNAREVTTQGTTGQMTALSGDAKALAGRALNFTLVGTEIQTELQGWARAEGARLVGAASFARAGGAGGAQIDASAFAERIRARAVVDVGWLTGDLVTSNAAARAQAQLGFGFSAGLGVNFVRRAPTLDELYAPRGFVVGNPNLAPETIADVELSAAFAPSRMVELHASVFAGRIVDAIVYVSRNAFEIAPTNTGGASRAGGDATLSVAPIPLFGFDVSAQGLWSSLDDTGAPLPRVPAFATHLHARIGERYGAAVHANLRHRGQTSNTLFGTVTTAPYTLFDVRARLPIGRHVAVDLSVANVFDVQTAQDANLLPLPGRSIFISLEVFG